MQLCTESLRSRPSSPRSRATLSWLPRTARGSRRRPPGASWSTHSGRTSSLPTVSTIRSYGGAVGVAERAVAAHQPDVGGADRVEVRAGRGQVVGGGLDQVRVDVDGGHRAGAADHGRHQRGVVAGAGADLQDALARAQAELLEHDRHHRRLGGRAGGHAIGEADRDGVVGVGLVQAERRQEQVAGHRAERPFDHGCADPAGRAQRVDHVSTRLLRHRHRYESGRPRTRPATADRSPERHFPR